MRVYANALQRFPQIRDFRRQSLLGAGELAGTFKIPSFNRSISWRSKQTRHDSTESAGPLPNPMGSCPSLHWCGCGFIEGVTVKLAAPVAG